MGKTWINHTEEIIECLDEFLKWNNSRWNRNVVEQIKSFAINESLMAQADKELPFVELLAGQTRFIDIDGGIEEIE